MPKFDVSLTHGGNAKPRVLRVDAASPTAGAIAAYVRVYGDVPAVVDVLPVRVASEVESALMVRFGISGDSVVARVTRSEP
jgi:hypothetical protein